MPGDDHGRSALPLVILGHDAVDMASVTRAAIAGAAATGGLLLGRRVTHRWGATPEEHADALPGDKLVADPAIVATRAVTIAAEPEEVWAWLVQIGQDRGGMYSYDWLENLIGLDIHSTDRLRDEWQHPNVGDRVVLVAPGQLGMADGYSMPIERLDPPHTLVLRQAPPEHPWDAVWSFHIRPLDGGGSRLISRSRSRRHPGARGAADLVLDTVMDPITWLMTRKMLLGIRRRAEGRYRGGDADGPSNAPDELAAATSDGISRWDRRTRQRLAADVRSMELDDPPRSPELVTDADLEPLPEPAQRYLRWAGVLGRPPDRAFTARFVGQFRMRPGERWMPYRSWQFNATDPVTRLIHMRVDVAGVIPMFGTDSYLDRRGRMHGKVLGLVTVADGSGPEFDLGELVTYVNDAAMLAPSMLLTPRCVWTPVDDDSFDPTFTDGDNTVRARMLVDDDGRLLDFRTDDRWFAGVDPPVRTTWSTPIERWTTRRDGRPIPASGAAVWHLPDGEFTYARGAFDPELVQFGTSASA